jgi:dihydroxyacetone kinase-like protein
MSDGALRDGEQIVRIVARTAVDNETYFGELDAVVGDGDLGYSLARGFSKLLEGFDEMEYEDLGGLLKKSALVLSGRIGGTSGPIWGTAFLRTGVALTPTSAPTAEQVVAALRAGLEGIKQRGGADLGEKTLIDALQPAIDRLEAVLNDGGSASEAVAAAADAATEAAAATKGMVAMRGRAAYTGERSRDSVDAGATAVAVIFKAVAESWTPGGVPSEGDRS